MHVRASARLALLLAMGVAAATPVCAIGADLGIAEADVMPGPAETGGAPDAAAVHVAGVEMEAPLPAPVPLDAALALPLVDLAIEPAESAPAESKVASGGQETAGRGAGFLPQQVPPEAVAWGGASLLAVFAGLGASGLFSRIHGPAVLEHPARARLLELLSTQPGLTMQEVQERLGMAWGTTVHHIRRLEANGRVVSVRQGPRVLLYASGSTHGRAREALALIRNPTARRVAQAVVANPGIKTCAVSFELGIGAPSASKHLGRFTAAGLVEHPTGAGFVPTDRLRQALALA